MVMTKSQAHIVVQPGHFLYGPWALWTLARSWSVIMPIVPGLYNMAQRSVRFPSVCAHSHGPVTQCQGAILDGPGLFFSFSFFCLLAPLQALVDGFSLLHV